MAPFPSYTPTWHTAPYPSISHLLPSLSLHGKSAIITGGGSGIGLGISLALSQAGLSKLAIIGRRTSILTSAKSQILSQPNNQTEVFTYSADIANQKEVKEVFSRINSEFGGKPIDILVSNAGYFSGPRPLGTETEEEWSRAVEINIKGVYFISTAFVKIAAKDATIINVSSAIAHLQVVFPGFSSYAATKLAGSKIMEFVQQENPGMYVVNMHPGQVRETDMAAKATMSDDHIDDVELPGQFAVWLASPEAKFLKGKFLWCNWDVDELKANAKEIESTALLTIGLNDFPSFKY